MQRRAALSGQQLAEPLPSTHEQVSMSVPPLVQTVVLGLAGPPQLQSALLLRLLAEGALEFTCPMGALRAAWPAPQGVEQHSKKRSGLLGSSFVGDPSDCVANGSIVTLFAAHPLDNAF